MRKYSFSSHSMVGRNEGYGMNDEEERNRSEATREGNVEMIF